MTLYQRNVKTEFLQLVSKKQQQIESLARKEQWHEFKAGSTPLFFLLGLWKETGLIALWEEGPWHEKETSDTPKETDSSYSDSSLDLNLAASINFMCPVYGVAKKASQGSVPQKGHTQ